MLGLSGAGKSTLGAALAAAAQWRHLEMDHWEEGAGDGLALHGLSAGWDDLKAGRGAGSLVGAIRRLIASEGCAGAVLTFPSSRILGPAHIEALLPEVRVVYLTGKPALCLAAFLQREAETGRDLPAESWRYYNEKMLRVLRTPALRPYQVDAFQPDGRRKPIAGLLSELGVSSGVAA